MKYLVAILVSAVLFIPSLVVAQTICTTRGEIVKQLGKRYSEAPVALGLSRNGGVVEVFSTTDGNTWTMVITMPDGTSCMMAAGESWEMIDKLKNRKGSF